MRQSARAARSLHPRRAPLIWRRPSRAGYISYRNRAPGSAASAAGDRVRRRSAAFPAAGRHIDDAEDDGLVAEAIQGREVEAELRGLSPPQCDSQERENSSGSDAGRAKRDGGSLLVRGAGIVDTVMGLPAATPPGSPSGRGAPAPNISSEQNQHRCEAGHTRRARASAISIDCGISPRCGQQGITL
jgi:hypothetical protein